jgi:bifunctional UDP-N-acetylglucosamine pyrophosphorylase/glucosamine-1-phosphate N-acetyltransferase
MSHEAVSIIMAAGRGSRMKNFDGSKALLPMVPGSSPFEGNQPILLHILKNLPSGPKAIVIHHKKQQVIEATRSLGVTYCEQPQLDGTGGALLAARGFLEAQRQGQVIITMGDVPFVTNSSYLKLLQGLQECSLMVLAFRPADKRQYGVLEMDGTNVLKIIEWTYWKTLSRRRQRELNLCNAGIYAARKMDLLHHLPELRKRPHPVTKERDGDVVELKEYFITDLVELMTQGRHKVGCVIAEGENEVMGIDDLPSLLKAQETFKRYG